LAADRSGSANNTTTSRAQLISIEDSRFRHQAAALWNRGPRLVAELLAEIARDRMLGGYIEALMVRYCAIPDIWLDCTGAREFPPLPLHVVPK
jgi:hypothetical protein